MLSELKEKLKGKYPDDSALILEEIEHRLSFREFDSKMALEVGGMMVTFAQPYKEDLVICIVREKDGLPVFQYVGDGCSKRNIDFAMGKRNTTLKTGHCSLWAMAQEQITGGVKEVFCENSGCLPVGGAFPIYVADQMVASIAVSGLHNGMDHKLIVDTLCEYLHQEVPEFNGYLI